MAWYKNGQVTVQNGSRTVLGAGTAWLTQVLPGEGLDVLDGRLHEIAEVINNTELLLVDAYAGANAAGVAYQIIPSASMTKELTRRVNVLVAKHEEVMATIDPDALYQELGKKVDAQPNAGLMTDEEREKLYGVAMGATDARLFGVGAALENRGVYNLNNAALGTVIAVSGTEASAIGNNWPATGFTADTVVWFNVQTFGSATRKTQIAHYPLGNILQDRVWIRSFHDNTWSGWNMQPLLSKANGWSEKQAFGAGATVPTPAVTTSNSDAASTAFAHSAAEYHAPKGGNVLDNPHMDISWRGASFAIPAAPSGSSIFTLDRWLINKFSSATGTVTRAAGSATWENINCLQYTIGTAQAALAANSFEAIEQVVEGYNLRELIGNDAMVGVWLSSSKVGTYTVRLGNIEYSRVFQHEVTITQANVWQPFFFPIPGGIPGTSVSGLNAEGAIRFGVVLAAGTGRRGGVLDAWQNSAAIGGPNQVNFLDTAGAVFRMTGAQLYAGNVARNIPRRPMGEELDRCFRHLPVINADNTLQYGSIIGVGQAYSGVAAIVPVPFRVQARAKPTGIQLSSVLSAHSLSGSDTNPYGIASLNLYNYNSLDMGPLQASIGSSNLSPGSSTMLFATAPILYLGCALS